MVEIIVEINYYHAAKYFAIAIQCNYVKLPNKYHYTKIYVNKQLANVWKFCFLNQKCFE